MTNEEFVRNAKTIAASHTMYASGTFGQLFSEAFIKQKQSQYPLWYSPYRVDAIRREAASGPLYLFDCCGLIKAIIWNWPNTKYASNNLPDVNDSGIWTKYCYDCSSDFSSIEPGEIMHMQGHVGIYIGGGKVVEATTRWENKVLVSSIYKEDTHFRQWQAHGKLKQLEYTQGTEPGQPAELAEPAPYSDVTYYIVKKGDCLSKIAAIYNMKLKDIIELNPQIINPNLIYPWQKIRIK